MRTYLATAAAAIALLTVVSSANAQVGTDACGFEHPIKAKKMRTSLVQAFVQCSCHCIGAHGNDETESGIQSCSPPETYNELSAGYPDGWMWDESNGEGNVTLKAAKNTIVNPVLNPEGDTADVTVAIKLKGIGDGLGPATGNGFVSTYSRITWRDRRGTPGNNTDDDPMTVVDLPATFPMSVTAGKGQLKTSFNVVLNGMGTSLPKCSSLEIIDISLYDEIGDRFASMGVFLPAR